MLKLVVLIFVLASQVFSAVGFANPIKEPNGSDPFMVFHEGFYYLTTTTWTNIQITRATTIAGLKTATPKVVWTDSTASRNVSRSSSSALWKAAEGAWFIYYVAGTTGTFDNQRVHALRGSASIIWDSTWSYASRIAIPNRDVWSIDPTVLINGANEYLVYSSFDGANQCLYIAQFTSATTVGNAVKISTPTNSWEIIGGPVNEGPAALYHGGFTWIVFSASSCAGTGYELGRLTLTGTDPLSASSWTKYVNPIFTSANGCVYHASSTSPALCDGSRYTMAQQVGWHTDGTPNLGSPRALTDSVPEPV
ncbi:Arabinanase/levansucrase/invertase [Mycena epipterygia]|nr:Arabinanase/levansucrase/invertase [Mycena epipterygia]